MKINEFDEGRLWFRESRGLITVGITEKVLEEIGEPQSIDLPEEGDSVTLEDVIAEIEGSKSSFEVIAPKDGMIFEVNPDLHTAIEILRDDPREEGWICRIQLGVDDESEASDEDSDQSNED